MNDDRDLGGGEAMLLSIGQAGGRDLLTEAVDIGLDGALDPGLLRDLPVIGWFVKGADVAAAIRDRFFAKKVLGFVAGTNSASAGATKEFVDDLSEPKERRRAGETPTPPIPDRGSHRWRWFHGAGIGARPSND